MAVLSTEICPSSPMVANGPIPRASASGSPAPDSLALLRAAHLFAVVSYRSDVALAAWDRMRSLSTQPVWTVSAANLAVAPRSSRRQEYSPHRGEKA